jgi:hypothetical protein
VSGIVTNETISYYENFYVIVPDNFPVEELLDCISAQLTKFPPLQAQRCTGWWMLKDHSLEFLWLLVLGSSSRNHRWDLGLSIAHFNVKAGTVPLSVWANHDLDRMNFSLLVYIGPYGRSPWMISEVYQAELARTQVLLLDVARPSLAEVEEFAATLLFAIDTSNHDPPSPSRYVFTVWNSPPVSDCCMTFMHERKDIHRIAGELRRDAYPAIMRLREAAQLAGPSPGAKSKKELL